MMDVKDLLFVTEEETKIEICDINDALWEGTVDEIDFLTDIPYGHYEVSKIEIIGSTLKIHI